MNNLLSSNLSRLFKSKIFYFFTGVILVVSLLNNTDGKIMIDQVPDFDIKMLEDYFYSMAPSIGIIQAVFIGFFLGTDYSNGTIRNKIIVGHTRTNIYLANFITMIIASLIMIGVWYLSGSINLFIVYNSTNLTRFMTYLGVILSFTFTFTSLFTLVSMISTSRSLTLIYNCLLWLCLLMAALYIYDILSIPELIGGLSYTDGQFVMQPYVPNPNYVGGNTRTIFEFILITLPTGSAILTANLEVTRPVFEILITVLLGMTFLVAGLIVFNRKNIK